MRYVTAVLLCLAALFGSSATASAEPTYQVCVGIDNELRSGGTYLSYLLKSYEMGKYMSADQEAQAKNIVQSVFTFCPEHIEGLKAATRSVTERTALR